MSEPQAHQTAFSQDQDRAESEPDPGRDIELELCALDMEDSDQQERKSQVSMIVYMQVLQYIYSDVWKAGV